MIAVISKMLQYVVPLDNTPTIKEEVENVRRHYLASLQIHHCPRKKPIVFAMIGNTNEREKVANVLVTAYDATLISTRAIQQLFQTWEPEPRELWEIAEAGLAHTMRLRGIAVIDSDYLKFNFRESLQRLCNPCDAQLLFIKADGDPARTLPAFSKVKIKQHLPYSVAVAVNTGESAWHEHLHRQVRSKME